LTVVTMVNMFTGDLREVSMADEPTCGQGLARHSDLLQHVAELVDSVADSLNAHRPALVPTDTNSQQEGRVYEELAAAQREAAAKLRAIAAEMAAQRDLPMGRHDVNALSPSDVTDALERTTRAEAQLITHLQDYLNEHQAILDALRT
jgi:hypothetical protein